MVVRRTSNWSGCLTTAAYTITGLSTWPISLSNIGYAWPYNYEIESRSTIPKTSCDLSEEDTVMRRGNMKETRTRRWKLTWTSAASEHLFVNPSPELVTKLCEVIPEKRFINHFQKSGIQESKKWNHKLSPGVCLLYDRLLSKFYVCMAYLAMLNTTDIKRWDKC